MNQEAIPIIELPEALKRLIENDTIDFATKATRNFPIKKSLVLLFFGTAWTAIISIFIRTFIDPFLAGKTISVPGLVIGLFFIIGIGILIGGISSFFQKGGYFIGTATRLIKYRNGKLMITEWNKFTETIELTHKNGIGTLEFILNTGRTEKSINTDRTASRFIPDIIYITGIQNVYEIEKKCRVRIIENTKSRIRS